MCCQWAAAYGHPRPKLMADYSNMDKDCLVIKELLHMMELPES
jgi:hypothetical protein